MIVDILGFTLNVVFVWLIIFLWVIIALWPASIAAQKGHSFFGWFLLSLFFWWITLFVVLFALEDKSDDVPAKSSAE